MAKIKKVEIYYFGSFYSLKAQYTGIQYHRLFNWCVDILLKV